MKARHLPLLLAGACALFLCGCATGFGPRTIPPERLDYNRFIARSADEQVLLNLVRMRYDDTPLFMELDSVVTQYTLDASINGAATIDYEGTSDNEYGVGGSVGFSERPTVTYRPLQGMDFARRMLTPIAPESIMLLSQAGWSIERLFLLAIKSINGIPNAVTASGPTPEIPPEFEQFHKLTDLLRTLQNAGYLRFDLQRDPQTGESKLFLYGSVSPNQPFYEERLEMMRMLKLSTNNTSLRLTTSLLDNQPDELAMTGRSAFGLLYYLSQSVEPPPQHIEKGLLVITRDSQGNEFDWSQVTGKLMRIHSSGKKPSNAFVRVRYRGHWFYIQDGDSDSKRTFGLLNYILSLMAAESQGMSPLLTLPAGG